MSNRLTVPRTAAGKTIAAVATVVVLAVLAALLATTGSDSRPSSGDALLQTVAAARSSANGQQPNQLVAGLKGQGLQAAVFDSNGQLLAGDGLSLSPADRQAALAGRTALLLGPNETQVVALSNGAVLVAQRSGAQTGYQPGSVSVLWVVVTTVLIGLLGLAVGLVLGRLTGRRAGPAPSGGRGPAPPLLPAGSAAYPGPSAPPPPSPVQPAPPPPSAKSQVPQHGQGVAAPTTASVGELVRRYLRLVDTTNSPALHQEALEALRAAGFTLIDPVGQQFDPQLHVAVGRRATTDPRSHNLVAETVRPGCYGDGLLVREAEVIVFRTDVGEQP